jgi:hypothetical protein
MEHRFLTIVQRWHFFARPLYWLSILCLIATFAWPIVQTSVDTLYWLSALSGSAFLLSTAAVLDISIQHGQAKKGLKGWLSKLWTRVLFWLWFLASVSLLVFLFKIITYMTTH